MEDIPGLLRIVEGRTTLTKGRASPSSGSTGCVVSAACRCFVRKSNPETLGVSLNTFALPLSIDLKRKQDTSHEHLDLFVSLSHLPVFRTPWYLLIVFTGGFGFRLLAHREFNFGPKDRMKTTEIAIGSRIQEVSKWVEPSISPTNLFAFLCFLSISRGFEVWSFQVGKSHKITTKTLGCKNAGPRTHPSGMCINIHMYIYIYMKYTLPPSSFLCEANASTKAGTEMSVPAST